MDIIILKNEIDTDPLGRLYSGMDDAAVAADMNTKYRTSNKSTMEATEVLNAINKTEFNTLTSVDQQKVWDVLHIGTINPFGIEADLFVDIFGGGSATISTLQTLRKNNISRGEELGIGVVYEADVQDVRRIP